VEESVALRSNVGSNAEVRKRNSLTDCLNVAWFCAVAERLLSIPDNYQRAAKWMNFVIGCACLTEQ
jgi:hypothetical protein